MCGAALMGSNDSRGVRSQSGSTHQNHDQRNDEQGSEEAAAVVAVAHVKSPLARNWEVIEPPIRGPCRYVNARERGRRHFALKPMLRELPRGPAN